MTSSQTRSRPGLAGGDSSLPLESILCTEELHRRPSRLPDYQTENRALSSLAGALADSPDTILQALADAVLEVLQADSAGLSLLAAHDDARSFYWPAIAGAWSPHVGRGTPRDFGPCGDVLDVNAPLLFRRFERRYLYLVAVTPPAEEALLNPFFVDGKAVGTIWAMAHDDRKKFDAEDLRQLESLSRFASAAYRAAKLRQSVDSRRAALNLMEDAVQARQAVETLNRELRESERRFREMIDALPAGVYTTDAEGRLTHYNHAAVALSGRTPELGTDRWCVSWKLYHPDGTPSPPDEYPMAIARTEGNPVRGTEAIAERPDGSRVWFQPYLTPLRNSAGEIVGGIHMLVDITERKRAEEIVRRSEERFRSQIEQVRDYAIFRTDLEGRALTWNQGVQRILGFNEEDFIGKDVVEAIFTPEDVRSGVAQEELDTAAATGTARNDRWMQRRSGERFFANGITTALKDEAGALVGFTKVMRDMTEQREMENRIGQQAEELAGEARRKDEFLAMLGHELRNPLAPIQSALYLMKEHEPGSENPIPRQAREVIERQVANLTKLVNDLLEVSRVSSGRIHLNLEVVDMNEVIENALQTAGPQFAERMHTVSVDLCSEPAWVSGDPTRLEEVLINLFNNAAKFTPDGGRIEVSCERPHQENAVRVRVRDSGIGIDEQVLPHIYDLFSQADSSLARSAGGLGIGLSLVHRLVQLHGGTIQASSPPADLPEGRGTEFIVTLPLALAPDMPGAVEHDTVVRRAPDGLRVLLVDDNIDVVMMVGSVLRDKGYSVKSAHDGPGGLEVAREWRPDVMLLDIGLPGLDGYEVARRLRADTENFGRGGFPGRLIALTGYGRDGDTARAREAGFDAHMVKPYGLDELEELIQSSDSTSMRRQR